MAHTAPPSSSSRRGVELAFGLVLLLVGGLVAVVAVVALHHPQGPQAAGASVPQRSTSAGSPQPKGSTATSSASQSPASQSPSPAGSAPAEAGSAGGKLPLVVLNNTSTIPASVATSRLAEAGWTATDGGSFDGEILSTAAYYDPDVAGAQQAALELQREFPAIQRVKPKFDGLPQGPIVVVLTSDYS